MRASIAVYHAMTFASNGGMAFKACAPFHGAPTVRNYIGMSIWALVFPGVRVCELHDQLDTALLLTGHSLVEHCWAEALLHKRLNCFDVIRTTIFQGLERFKLACKFLFQDCHRVLRRC